MLSNGFAAPIRLEPKTSTRFLVFIVITHTLAVIALMHPSSLNYGVRLLFVLAVIASGIYHYRKQKFAKHGLWIWQTSGDWQSVQDNFTDTWQLQRIYSLTRYFVALRLVNNTGKRQDLLWVYDQFDAQTFRRLRVRLAYAQVEATRPGETS